VLGFMATTVAEELRCHPFCWYLGRGRTVDVGYGRVTACPEDVEERKLRNYKCETVLVGGEDKKNMLIGLDEHGSGLALGSWASFIQGTNSGLSK